MVAGGCSGSRLAVPLARRAVLGDTPQPVGKPPHQDGRKTQPLMTVTQFKPSRGSQPGPGPATQAGGTCGEPGLSRARAEPPVASHPARTGPSRESPWEAPPRHSSPPKKPPEIT